MISKENQKNMQLNINKKNNKEIKEQNNGITLIALVVTIVVLLILAGVTITMVLGQDGIITQAQNAAQLTLIANEREYLEQNAISTQLSNILDDTSQKKLGETLYDRNLENSSIWDIVVEQSTNKTYGTGWNYVEKGTELDGYGEAKYNWLVNYETGEVIQLEDKTYDKFDYKSSLAVENPLFNLDSANVGLDKSSWGSNATLYYYDNTQYGTIEARKTGYELEKGKNVTNFVGYDRQKSENISEYLDETTGAFKFNGNNYIEINNPKTFDFSEGMTFEFYGNITEPVAATITEQENEQHNKTCGLFGFWNGNYNEQCNIRFNWTPCINNRLFYSLADYTDQQHGEWDWTGAPWNQYRNIGNILNKDIYITITIDNKEQEENNEHITQSVYIYENGKRTEYIGWYRKDMYEKFIEAVNKLNYLELGRCTCAHPSNWCYFKGLCYSTRIYNKALSSDEVQANYDATTKFHKYIIDSKK